MEIVASENVTVTENDKNNIREGVRWLDDWLQKRLSNDAITQNLNYIVTGDDDLPHWQERYQQCSDKLKNVKVIVGQNVQDIENMIKKELKAGRLHFNERYIRRHKNEDLNTIIENFKIGSQGGELYGAHYTFIQEPAIFLTEKALNENITSSIVAHECTHMLDLFEQEDSAKKAIDNDHLYADRTSMYLDSREEVYARTMQFRKAFKLDPNKEYTIDDVAKIRAEYEKNHDFFGNLNKFLPKNKSFSYDEYEKAMQKAKSKINLEQKELQNNFLDRYSDEQIMRLLNDTASIDRQLPKDYDELKQKMQNDLALSTAKVRKFEKENTASRDTKSHSTVSKTTDREQNVVVIQNINDNQYS